MNYQLRESSFQEIYPIWKKQLWPGRKTKIISSSSMSFQGGYDMKIYKNDVFFWKIINQDGSVIGVNSAFQTSKKEFRSRGLFVDPNFRRQGISQLLLREASLMGKELKCTILWSFPRLQSFFAYKRFGFNILDPIISEDVEFGPNAYAFIKI